MLTENLIKDRSIKYANEFEELNSLVSYIISDVQEYPFEAQRWFYNYSYFDLSNGLLGNCVFLAEMDYMFPEKKFASMAHQILKVGVNRKQILKINTPSLWSGLTGVCFTIKSLSKNYTRYENLLIECEKILKPLIKNKIFQAKTNLKKNDVQMTDFDVIEGLSGIAVYLFEEKERDVEFQNLLDEITDYFILLCDYKDFGNTKVPKWHISKDNQFLESEKIHYPQGNFNLGQSHGISGILSVLSHLVTMESSKQESIKSVITLLTDWLINNHICKDNSIFWEKKMSLEHYLYNDSSNDYLNFSWCYGDLTIARAIWLAGKSIDNTYYQDFAISCFKKFKQKVTNHKLESPTYCHGFSGALHLMIEMKKDTNLTFFKDMESYFLNLILRSYNTNSKFGFQDVEKLQNKEFFFDKTGLLTGASGTYLVLLYYLKPTSKTGWPNLFLI